MPALAKGGRARGGEPARVVVTASEVHDPASAGGAVGPPATLGDLRGLERAAARAAAGERPEFDMVDGGLWDGEKAYKDSKLCNVLFTRELQRRIAAAGGGDAVDGQRLWPWPDHRDRILPEQPEPEPGRRGPLRAGCGQR